MNQPDIIGHDFSTISPSAKWLLLLKGYTRIPFARQAAELIQYPEPFTPDFKRKDLVFWIRTFHFETRYLGINQLLKGLVLKNILELSSGYSLRGLEMIKSNKIHYIDTDLPEVIETKSKLIDEIRKRLEFNGKLELLALNALDKEQFEKTINRFSEGEIIIVNEGLFMYLSSAEKEQLAGIIHEILARRKGYWIIGDIYLKNELFNSLGHHNSQLKEYYYQQNIEENKFETFEEAEVFFNKMGFRIDKEAKIFPWRLSSFKYVLRCLTLWQLIKGLVRKRKIHATWRLSAV